MNTYKTAEVAAETRVHPNTVRLYEEWEMIPKAKRQPNGYRVFTDFHIEQFKLARLAFKIEVLQSGLRKKIIQMVKVSATGDFDEALSLAAEYLEQLQRECNNAEEAVILVQEILSGEATKPSAARKRKEVSEYLGISMDTLRNWEMNGLLNVKRKKTDIAFIRTMIYGGSKLFAVYGAQTTLWKQFYKCFSNYLKIQIWIYWSSLTRQKRTRILSPCATN